MCEQFKGSECVAQCPGGCINGNCVAPNTCACKPGWTLDKAGKVCTPHCSHPCLNGECTGPDTCTCRPGYIKDFRIIEGKNNNFKYVIVT